MLKLTYSQDLDLPDLLDGIHEHRVVIPDFQRPFVWSERDVAALLATVIAGWPVGCLLLTRGRAAESLFNVRGIDGTPERLDDTDYEYSVLDGQQRLTALYQALSDRGAQRYALDWDQLLTDDAADTGSADAEAIEDAIVIEGRSTRSRLDFGRQLESGQLIPMSALRSPVGFFEWRDRLAARQSTPDSWAQAVTDVYRTNLSGMDRYKIPCIITPADSVPAAAIARIFERVNRTGVRLSVFDLMVARSYGPEFNLRSAWESVPDNLESFLLDGLPVLQAISLTSSGDTRESAVLRLSSAQVAAQWSHATEAASATVDRLRRLGVLHQSWLPYPAQFVVMAAVGEQVNDATAAGWFWRTTLDARFRTASNSASKSEFRGLEAERTFSQPALVTVSATDWVSSTRIRSRAQFMAFRSFLASQLMDHGVAVDATWNLIPDVPAYRQDGDYRMRTLAMVLAPRGRKPLSAEIRHLQGADILDSMGHTDRGMRARLEWMARELDRWRLVVEVEDDWVGSDD